MWSWSYFFFLFCWSSENHLLIAPQSPVLEVGTNFTATCMIINTAEVTADDLYWNLSKTTVPKEQYTKINKTALNVTILITGETNEWLFCLCKEKSPFVVLNNGKFIHGINIEKGCKFLLILCFLQLLFFMLLEVELQHLPLAYNIVCEPLRIVFISA